MLPSQVGAIDLTRPGNKGIASMERVVPVTRSHLRRVLSFWLASVLICAVIAAPQVSGQSKVVKRRRARQRQRAGPGEQADEHSAANWAAKGLYCQILMVTVSKGKI
jgi:hypothetical protein